MSGPKDGGTYVCRWGDRAPEVMQWGERCQVWRNCAGTVLGPGDVEAIRELDVAALAAPESVEGRLVDTACSLAEAQSQDAEVRRALGNCEGCTTMSDKEREDCEQRIERIIMRLHSPGADPDGALMRRLRELERTRDATDVKEANHD